MRRQTRAEEPGDPTIHMQTPLGGGSSAETFVLDFQPPELRPQTLRLEPPEHKDTALSGVQLSGEHVWRTTTPGVLPSSALSISQCCILFW